MKISYNDVKDNCNELKKIKNDIESKINTIKQINFEASWKSDSQEYYCRKLKSFLAEYDKLILDIENSTKYILSVVENYENIDKKIESQTKSTSFHSEFDYRGK
jgi:hypothetical protein